MFRSQTMTRVELAVPEHDVVPVTEALAASGVFQPVRARPLSSERGQSEYADHWQDQIPVFARLEQRILAIMEALGVEEGSPPSETPHLIEPEVVRTNVERLERESQALVEKLEEERRRLDQQRRQLSQVQAVAGLDADLDELRHLRYMFVLLGTMPVANLERLHTSLELVPSVLVVLRREDHMATVVLFGTRRDADVLNRAARSAYLNPLDLPETCRGTPREVMASLEAGIQRTLQHIEEYEADIEHLHELHTYHLRHLLWRVRASRTLVETIAQYGRLRFTYLVNGWVPTPQLPALERQVKAVSEKVLFETETPSREDQSDVPVCLENPPFLKAFQGLVTNYGHPRYAEIDPTIVVALTFPLVFGIMFGDVAHGLILALLGVLLVSRVARPLRKMAPVGTILVACGITAMAFGFLYDSVFGFDGLLGWHWVQPLEDATSILLAAIFIGAGLLSLGMVLNVTNSLLARRWGHALFGHNSLAGLIFYWSLIGLAATILGSELPIRASWLGMAAIGSGLAIGLGKALERWIEGDRPLIEEGIVTFLMQAFFGVFEMVIGLLSNTLSYVRTGAFAVAHGALGVVVLRVAETLDPVRGVPFYVMVALGNLFIIGFEGMIVTIQTLRLEYYEFFGRFFSGSGLSYHPMELMRGEDVRQ